MIMNLTGTADKITANLTELCPQAMIALRESAGIKGQLLPYQAMALFKLASGYNTERANILEIGTLHGYSASIMAQAAPKATILTINPAEWEIAGAVKNLAPYKNVRVECVVSWDKLTDYTGPALDMIFVDGNHNRIARDLPWYQHLRVGGLMLFHDYCPTRSAIVYRELNAMANRIEHPFDVYLFDTDQTGMVGFIKRDGE